MTEKSDLPRIPPPPPPPVTGRDPPARQTTTEETFLIERIPVRFVVVILVLPSEGSSRRAARWIPLHPLGRRAPVAEGGVEWLAL